MKKTRALLAIGLAVIMTLGLRAQPTHVLQARSAATVTGTTLYYPVAQDKAVSGSWLTLDQLPVGNQQVVLNPLDTLTAAQQTSFKQQLQTSGEIAKLAAQGTQVYQAVTLKQLLGDWATATEVPTATAVTALAQELIKSEVQPTTLAGLALPAGTKLTSTQAQTVKLLQAAFTKAGKTLFVGPAANADTTKELTQATASDFLITKTNLFTAYCLQTGLGDSMLDTAQGWATTAATRYYYQHAQQLGSSWLATKRQAINQATSPLAVNQVLLGAAGVASTASLPDYDPLAIMTAEPKLAMAVEEALGALDSADKFAVDSTMSAQAKAEVKTAAQKLQNLLAQNQAKPSEVDAALESVWTLMNRQCGLITLKYQDTKGKTIHADYTTRPAYGQPYTGNLFNIPGYEYVRFTGPEPAGSGSAKDKTTILIYRRLGSAGNQSTGKETSSKKASSATGKSQTSKKNTDNLPQADEHENQSMVKTIVLSGIVLLGISLGLFFFVKNKRQANK